MKTFTDYMREADARGIPDLRKAFVKELIGLWGGEAPPTCAIGGANAARGVEIETEPSLAGLRLTDSCAWAFKRTPEWWKRQSEICCPHCGKREAHLEAAVPHLYDRHEWSRTQIADWIDGTFGRDHDESDWLER